jgi:hypothetical protein
MMPMMATTISSSMRVKPLASRNFFMVLLLERFGYVTHGMWAVRAVDFSNVNARPQHYLCLMGRPFNSKTYRAGMQLVLD